MKAPTIPAVSGVRPETLRRQAIRLTKKHTRFSYPPWAFYRFDEIVKKRMWEREVTRLYWF